MSPKRACTSAVRVLVALLACFGPVPAMAGADRAQVSDAALVLYFGSDGATPLRAAQAEAIAPSSAEAFDEARDLYAQGRWSVAYGRFARLADEGHAEAAGIALLMLSNGARLYGQSWSASQPQIDRWVALSYRRTQAITAVAGR